jgi:hypothetical protein
VFAQAIFGGCESKLFVSQLIIAYLSYRQNILNDTTALRIEPWFLKMVGGWIRSHCSKFLSLLFIEWVITFFRIKDACLVVPLSYALESLPCFSFAPLSS